MICSGVVKSLVFAASRLFGRPLLQCGGRIFSLILLCSLCFACGGLVLADADEPQRVGWLEQVRIGPPDILLHAKLDTGADNCSVHAENIRRFRRGKERWVEFKLSNRYGARKKLQRKVIRTAKVKTKTGGIQERPVVRLGICLGEHFETGECNLVDRSHFSYPVLMGRNFLAGMVVVDSSDTYTKDPICSAHVELK